MSHRVLITGGSGMIGRHLTDMLLSKGYKVSWLSRSAKKVTGVSSYVWDLKKNQLDDEAVLNADYIIHLAGTNVFEEKWTEKVKESILDSRLRSANLLYGKIKILEQPVRAFISASGIGIYGKEADDSKTYYEDSGHGDDFLAEVVEQWEAAAGKIEQLRIRTVKVRTGIVLSEEDGALKKLLTPIKAGIGAPLGKGNQIVSWIHIDDLCKIYIQAIEDERMTGAYNAVSPNPVTNEDFVKKTAKVLGKPALMPNVPPFVLKMMLGKDRAELLLGGKKVSCEKLLKTGFKFDHPEMDEALGDLLKEKTIAS